MLRIAERPAAHVRPQLHEFDGNHHRRRTIGSFPIDYQLRCGCQTADESAIVRGSFSRLLDFRHPKVIESFSDYLATIALFSGLDSELD